jgi:hypothetical protein
MKQLLIYPFLIALSIICVNAQTAEEYLCKAIAFIIVILIFSNRSLSNFKINLLSKRF